MVLDIAIYVTGIISICLTVYECICSSPEEDKYEDIE
jgi:hypothetical protein